MPLIIHLTAVSGLCPSVAYFAEADHFAAAGLVAVVDLVVAVESLAAAGLVVVADFAAEADHFAGVELVVVAAVDLAAVVVAAVPARRSDSVRYDLAGQDEQGALPL